MIRRDAIRDQRSARRQDAKEQRNDDGLSNAANAEYVL